jgi:hypothetical protein
MHNRSLKIRLILATALAALSILLSACQGTQQPQSNGNAPDANTANASTANAPASGYIDLVGKWEGQSGGQPSTLFINNHMGDTFSGTKTVGDFQVAIAGVVDLKTRQITIRETNLIKGQGNYPLGLGSGVIAPNGRQMSGEWKAKGSASTFSFSK